MNLQQALRSTAAAVALGGLAMSFAPVAQAGFFTGSATAGLTLESIEGTGSPNQDLGLVDVFYSSSVFIADANASNPPTSNAGTTPLLDDVDQVFNIAIVDGLAEADSKYVTESAEAVLLSDGFIDVFNGSGDEVTLNFSWFYDLFVEVGPVLPGTSTAFARAQAIIDDGGANLIEALVSIDLDDLDTEDGATESGQFSLVLAAGDSALVELFANADGSASHTVAAPATLPLIALGIALTGYLSRRNV